MNELIHDELLGRAVHIVDVSVKEAKRDGRLRPLAVGWVGQSMVADDGATINDRVLCLLPYDSREHPNILLNFTQRIQPIALMWLRQEKEGLRATFTTDCGQVEITVPLTKRHGKLQAGDRKVAHAASSSAS